MPAYAAANAPDATDTTFGTDGTAAAPPQAAQRGELTANAVERDGANIWVVGNFWPWASSHNEIIVGKYTSAGQLVQGYGQGGFVTLTDKGAFDGCCILKFAVREDGSVVLPVTVSMGQRLGATLIQLDPNGNIDKSFAPVPVDDGGYMAPFALLTSDGGVLLGATTEDEKTDVVKYTATGALDRSYGRDGVATLPGWTWSGAVTPDDGLVMPMGAAIESSLVKLTSDGKIDTSFGSSGRALLGPKGSDPYPQDVAAYQNGEVVATAAGSNGGDHPLYVEEFTPSGKPDVAFGKGGISSLPTLTLCGNKSGTTIGGNYVALSYARVYVTIRCDAADGTTGTGQTYALSAVGQKMNDFNLGTPMSAYALSNDLDGGLLWVGGEHFGGSTSSYFRWALTRYTGYGEPNAPTLSGPGQCTPGHPIEVTGYGAPDQALSIYALAANATTAANKIAAVTSSPDGSFRIELSPCQATTYYAQVNSSNATSNSVYTTVGAVSRPKAPSISPAARFGGTHFKRHYVMVILDNTRSTVSATFETRSNHRPKDGWLVGAHRVRRVHAYLRSHGQTVVTVTSTGRTLAKRTFRP